MRRSEDLGGAEMRLEDRSLKKTSIVFYLMIGDLRGVETRLTEMRSLTMTNQHYL